MLKNEKRVSTYNITIHISKKIQDVNMKGYIVLCDFI